MEQLGQKVIDQINRHYEVDQEFVAKVQEFIEQEVQATTAVKGAKVKGATVKSQVVKAKKPLTAYQIYMKQKTKELGQLPMAERMKIISTEWKKVTKEEKDKLLSDETNHEE